MEVVEKNLFEKEMAKLVARLDRMEQELELYKKLAPSTEWISRKDAMKFLCVGETKLWELTKFNKIKSRRVGGKVLYNTASLRTYLEGTGVPQEAINQQFYNTVRSHT